jgi:hypothetical protein
MEKALVKLAFHEDEQAQEYTVVRTLEDLDMYIEELSFDTQINKIKLNRACAQNKNAAPYFDGVERMRDSYTSIYRDALYMISGIAKKMDEPREMETDKIIKGAHIIAMKKETMRRMINEGKVLYVNKRGGMMPENPNMTVVQTWHEQSE